MHLFDVCFTKIVLSAAPIPSMRHLRIENVPDECDLTLEISRLMKCSIHFLSRCDDVIKSMLDHASSL